MNKKLEKNLPFPLFLLILALTVIFSIGKTLQYYFYTDDYASLYNVQHNYPHPPLYHAYSIFLTPIYKLFGLQAEPYFFMGILTFFLTSLGVYFFIKILTKNNLIAILSSLIFATGYIGIDQFTMMILSLTNNPNIINVCVTLVLFILWIDTRKLRFYLATLLAFWFSVILVPFRAFPLVLFLPTVEMILSFKREHPLKILKKLTFIFLRFIPFLLIGYHIGILTYSKTGENVPTLLALSSLKELFAILGRFVLLGPLAKISNFGAGICFTFVIILLVFYFSLIKKYSRLGRSLLVVLLLTIEGYIGNLLLLPTFNSNGAVSRYLTIAFLGYCAILPILIYLLIEKITEFIKMERLRWFVPVLVLPLIITMALLSREYEENIIKERSLPARQFFKQLKNFLPSISGKNLFYFDRADYYPVASRFGNIIVGAHRPKEVTLAVPYDVSLESIKIVDDFDALFTALKNKEVNIDHLHSFYYDKKGLQQTTAKLLSILDKGDKNEVPLSQVDYASEIAKPAIEFPLKNISSLTPIIINLNLKLTPLNPSFFTFPFYNLLAQDENQRKGIKKFYEKNRTDKSLIFAYLLARKRYYENVRVEVSSSHPIDRGNFLIDDNAETWWMVESGPWLVGPKTWIKIDLGEERRISKLIWHPLKDRVPSDYRISVSLDGLSWQVVQGISTDTSENFAPVEARFVMMEINKTITGWEPAVSEIEVVEDQYKNVDIPLALRIKENPFEFIKDEKEIQETYDYLRQGGFLIIQTLTNKDADILNNYNLRTPILLDGLYHMYSIPLSPRGTNLEKIKLELNFPAKIEVEKIEIIHPSLKELIQ